MSSEWVLTEIKSALETISPAEIAEAEAEFQNTMSGGAKFLGKANEEMQRLSAYHRKLAAITNSASASPKEKMNAQMRMRTVGAAVTECAWRQFGVVQGGIVFLTGWRVFYIAHSGNPTRQ